MKREAGREWVNVYRKESVAQRDWKSVEGKIGE